LLQPTFCHSRLSEKRLRRWRCSDVPKRHSLVTYYYSSHVVGILDHEIVQLPKDVMPCLSNTRGAHYQETRLEAALNTAITLAVVLDHDLNANAASSMTSLVSATPMSGTVPRKSPLAGSASYHR
jgi:hypothetical protein